MHCCWLSAHSRSPAVSPPCSMYRVGHEIIHGWQDDDDKIQHFVCEFVFLSLFFPIFVPIPHSASVCWLPVTGEWLTLGWMDLCAPVSVCAECSVCALHRDTSRSSTLTIPHVIRAAAALALATMVRHTLHVSQPGARRSKKAFICRISRLNNDKSRNVRDKRISMLLEHLAQCARAFKTFTREKKAKKRKLTVILFVFFFFPFEAVVCLLSTRACVFRFISFRMCRRCRVSSSVFFPLKCNM